ncbi:MAG: hypothetical protein KF813_05155 [Trueperaceae bacterium]|nr:hypothetical protein [Trueperaceae bacterium]
MSQRATTSRLVAPVRGRVARLTRSLAIVCVFVSAAAALAAPAVRGQILAAEAMNASLAVPELYVALQSLPNSCGPAAVATLAGWSAGAEGAVSEAAVLAHAELGPSGVSLAEFSRLAARHGVPGAWYRVEPSSLGSLATPFAAHLTRDGLGHFVVVLHVKGQLAVVADPAVGGSVVPLAALREGFSGLVFVVRSGS